MGTDQTPAIDFLRLETGTRSDEREEAEDPNSGVGANLYFAHPELGIWRVNDDQGPFSCQPCGGRTRDRLPGGTGHESHLPPRRAGQAEGRGEGGCYEPSACFVKVPIGYT